MNALPQGTILQGGKYRIEKLLGQDDFSINYLAECVGYCRKVVIKEFFMRGYCSRSENGRMDVTMTEGIGWAVACAQHDFLENARLLVSLSHPNIVRLDNFFEENNTAYCVRRYVEGQTLESIIDERGQLEEEIAIQYLKKYWTHWAILLLKEFICGISGLVILCFPLSVLILTLYW